MPIFSSPLNTAAPVGSVWSLNCTSTAFGGSLGSGGFASAAGGSGGFVSGGLAVSAGALAPAADAGVFALSAVPFSTTWVCFVSWASVSVSVGLMKR